MNISKILTRKEVPVNSFCCMTSQLYNSINCQIHHVKKEMSLAEIKEGFESFGMGHNRLLNFVEVLYDIKNAIIIKVYSNILLPTV